MTLGDPLQELAHDHGALNRLVLEFGAQLRGEASREPTKGLTSINLLSTLREDLFHHFAREEEGLFPFISEIHPELDARVNEIVTTHDTICGALARLLHLAAIGAPSSTLEPVFTRFETAYGSHAAVEAELLRYLEDRLDADQRLQLASLVRGL